MEKEPKTLSNGELLDEFTRAVNDTHDAFKGYAFYTDGGTRVHEREAALREEIIRRLAPHV